MLAMYRLTRLVLTRPGFAALGLALVTVALGAGLPHVRTEFGSRVLIGGDHPAILKLDAFIARYGGGVPHYIAWECGPGRPCGSVFDDASLEMADRVTTALIPLEAVRQVYSPSNAPVLVADADGFAIRRFVEGGEISPERDELARLALEDPTWVGNLVSSDQRVGALVVQPSGTDSATDERIVAAILEAIAPYEAFDFKLIGEAFGNILGGRELADSTNALVPIMVLLIALVIYAQTLSLQSVFVTLLTLGVALVWTFGLLGWIGWPRDSVLEILAPLILIIGVCDSIHFLSERARAVRGSASGAAPRGDPLLRAAREVSAPCTMTTLTTSAAFISFATSDLDTFIRFGVMSAFGVVACLVLTFTLLPLLASKLPPDPPRSEKVSETWDAILTAIADSSERRARPILVGSTILLLCSAMGWALYLRVDTSRQELFGENSRILQWVGFFEDNLRPSSTLEIDVSLPPGQSPESPDVLAAITAFSESVASHHAAGEHRSVVDLLTRTRDLLFMDLAASGGESHARNAELLEILSFDDPIVLASWMSFDRTHLRISIDVPEQNFATAIDLLALVERSAEKHLLEGMEIETTGALPLGVDWVRDVQATQLRSFPTAFALVLGLVTLMLGSLRLGLAALVPAALPVVVVLGAMGFAGLSLDVGRAMIAAVVIGIAVDDAIHLLHRYEKEWRRTKSRSQAVRGALLETGRPIATTSLALALGFLTLTASAWGTVSSFGFFVSISILIALAATLFVVPALLLGLRRSPT